MEITKTEIDDVFILKPAVFNDNRGWFCESWSQKSMEEHGLYYNFVQDNHSFSSQKGILRGLHCQIGEFSQAKIVRCVRGTILDVAVDIRTNSKTYLKWVAVELSDSNFHQLLIPRGFLHGFLTLTDNVEIIYKADNFYSAKADRNVAWNDKEISVNWGILNPILSEKDKNAPPFDHANIDFKMEI